VRACVRHVCFRADGSAVVMCVTLFVRSSLKAYAQNACVILCRRTSTQIDAHETCSLIFPQDHTRTALG